HAAGVAPDLRQRLFAHLQRLHFGFHDRSQTGQLMARANSDLQQIQFFLVFIPLAIANTLTVVSIAVILLFINAPLALLALGALPFVNMTAKRFSSRIHPTVLALQQELGELASVVEETVSGVRVVKGFGAEPLQARRLRKEADDVQNVSLLAARIRSAYIPMLDLLPTIGLVMVVWFGGHQVLAGHLTVGGLTAPGKTTIARLLPRFSDVDAGRVVADGVDVRDARLHDLRRAVGLVFEDTFLFSDTVRANTAFADPAAPEAAVVRAARAAGAHEFISALPGGYDTMIGEHGYSLSGGQRQRIAIARAILADP